MNDLSDLIKEHKNNIVNFIDGVRTNAIKYGYNKAIDDFVEFINEMPTYENEYGEIMPMPVEMMAEQLKR